MSLCQKTISSSSSSNTMDSTKIINFPFFHTHHHHHHHQSSVFFNNPTVEMNSSSFPIPIPAFAIDNTTTAGSSIDSLFKMDPPGVGFLDDVSGTTVDGLMSCTESLGFESSDERRVDDLIHNLDEMEEYCLNKPSKNPKSKSKLVGKSKINKMFPPPLSSLSQDGKPVSYLQPMRIDGRLKLTEVKILRPPEVLRASREDGRLRLDLIQDRDDNEDDIKNIEEMDNGGVKIMQQQASDDVVGDGDEWLEERVESMLLLEDNRLKMESELDDDDDEWYEERAESQLLSQEDEGDGLVTRCYNGRGKSSPIPSRHHHHHGSYIKHDIHVWRQHLMC